MEIFRSYKTELDLNNAQIERCRQHAGCARKAYNWGLGRKIESYKATGKSPSFIDLSRELNLLKKKPVEEGGFPWMYESSKCAPQIALRNLDKAYENFFRRCKNGAKNKGFPKPKVRKHGIGNFCLTGLIRVSNTHIRLPVLGELRLKECGYLPVAGTHILSATVSEKVGRWFVSLQVRQEVSIPEPPQSNVIGVDVGIKHLAVTSDGQVFDNPKALTKAQGLLRTRQKAMDRKVKGSANRRKAQEKVAKTHYRIANIRKDAIHKMTSTITKSASVIVVETLNVAGMIKNHHLARALADASLSEIHRQLEYKAKWRGTTLLKADRFYPSSKRCSRCGHKKETLALSERVYRCEIPSCGHVMDRDLNAAINLKNLAGSSPVSACCPGSAGHARKSKTKLLVGQEPEAVGVGL